jgi:acyl carrier protein
MVAIEATEAELLPWPEELADRVAIAAVNGPRSVVVSGTAEAVTGVVERWRSRGRRTKVVLSSCASHSPLMDPLLTRYREVAAELTYHEPRIPIVSCVTGRLATAEELCDPDHWVRHLRRTVRFADGLASLTERNVGRILELSPSPVLTSLAEDCLDDETDPVALAAALRPDRDEAATVLTGVAHMYAHGASVNWESMFSGSGARPVDLPGYAFQRSRYWLAPRRRGDQLWGYRVAWQPVDPSSAPALSGTWLLVAPDARSVRADAVTRALETGGAKVLRAGPAAPFPDVELAGVVSLLALDESPHRDFPSVPVGLLDTVALIRRLDAAGVDAPLWTVTAGAVSTGPDDPLVAPMRAAVWGLGRVAAMEYPRRRGGLVDLPATGAVDLLTAVVAGVGDEDQVALRGDRAYGRRLVRAAVPVGDGWIPAGTVLLAAAEGTAGARTARWLCDNGADHLVVVTSPDEPAPRLDPGLDVEFVERSALADTVRRLAAEGRAVRSVVHAGGRHTPTTIDRLEPADLAADLDVRASLISELHDALDGEALDAFVIFSSVVGVWGGTGSAGRAAGCAVLDAYAQQQAASGRPVFSVAWGTWIEDPELRRDLHGQGLLGMGDEAAMTLLRRVVDGSGAGPVVVANVDWSRLAPLLTSARPSPFLDALTEAHETRIRTDDAPAATSGAPTLGEQMRGMEPQQRRRTLTNLVRSAVARVLGHLSADAVGADQAFQDLGFDSLTAVELRNRLNEATGLRLPATMVFDHPSVSAVVTLIHEQLMPDDVHHGRSVLSDLDDARAKLSATGLEPSDRARVIAVLRSMLTECERHELDDVALHRPEFDSISAEELFEFIDNKL